MNRGGEVQMTVWTPLDDGYADLSSHDAFADGAPHNTFRDCAARIRCTGLNMRAGRISGPLRAMMTSPR